MATELVFTLKPSGGDYSTMSAWEAACNCNLTTANTAGWVNQTGVDIPDGSSVSWASGAGLGTFLHMSTTAKSGADTFALVVGSGSLSDGDIIGSGGQTIEVNGSPDSIQMTLKIDGDWSGGADTTQCSINGWVASATQYVKIYTATDARHKGIYSTSYYVLSVSNQTAFGHSINANSFVYLDGIQIYSNNTTNFKSGISISASNYYTQGTWVTNCIVKGNNQDYSRGIYSSNSRSVSLYVLNNIVYGFTNNSSVGIGSEGSNGTHYFYNNTVYDCTTGIYDKEQGKTVILKNNISYNNGTDFSGSWDASSDYNFSKDDTAPEAAGNSIWGDTDSITPDFVSTTGGSEDFHIKETSGALEMGVDLGTGIWSIDIDGRDRDAEGDTWDIGADQFVAGVSGSVWYDATNISPSVVAQSVTIAISKTLSLSPDDAKATITPQAPTIEIRKTLTLSPGAGNASLAAETAAGSVKKSGAVTAGAANATIQIHSPTVNTGGTISVSPDAISVTLTAQTAGASVDISGAVAESANTISLTAQTATTEKRTHLNVAAGQIAPQVALHSPTVSKQVHKTVTAGLGSASFSAQSVEASKSMQITPDNIIARFVAQAPTITLGETLTLTPDAIIGEFDLHTPSIVIATAPPTAFGVRELFYDESLISKMLFGTSGIAKQEDQDSLLTKSIFGTAAITKLEYEDSLITKEIFATSPLHEG